MKVTHIFCLMKQNSPFFFFSQHCFLAGTIFFLSMNSCYIYYALHSFSRANYFSNPIILPSFSLPDMSISLLPTHKDILYFRCHGMSIASITIRTIDHAATKQLDDICHNTLCAMIMHLNFDAGGYWFTDL